MDKLYLMGNNDGLHRSNTLLDTSKETTFISKHLRNQLISVAMTQSFDFFTEFFVKEPIFLDYKQLIPEFEQNLSEAYSLGLLKIGGITEKDYLNFWCLARLFVPETYIESGVYKGSSLHAFLNSPNLKKVIAIDPKLSNLRIPENRIPGKFLIDDKDFSQIEFECNPETSLIYFDDHINTAQRILQASEKGFRYLVFDDSVGLEGICQRLYPAIPTIPMIIHHDLFCSGDELSWTFQHSTSLDFKSFSKMIYRKLKRQYTSRITLKVTDALIEQCRQAKNRIQKCSKIPDLGEYIPSRYPEKLGDTTKYLLEIS